MLRTDHQPLTQLIHASKENSTFTGFLEHDAQ
jgi:hypothetical protein